MKYVNWESAVGKPVLSLTVNTIRGTKVLGSEVETWFESVPNSILSQYFKGVTYLRITNNQDKGWECLQRTLETGLTGLQAYLIKSELIAKEKDRNQAIDYLVATLKLCNTSEEREAINGKIGYFLYSLGKYKEALLHYEAARNINSRPEWLNNIGCCHLKLGDVEKGGIYLKRTTQFVPYNNLIKDNIEQLDLLCGGKDVLINSIISILSKGVLDKKQKEQFLSLVSSAFEMDLISNEIQEECLLLADLVSGYVEKVINVLAESKEGFKDLGEGIEPGVFSLLYKYACRHWPISYSQRLRCAILNTCSKQTILDGLQKGTLPHAENQHIALRFVLMAFLKDVSNNNIEVIKDLTDALEHDCNGLLRIVETDSDVKKYMHLSDLATYWVQVGEKKDDFAENQYASDVAYGESKNGYDYFRDPKIFYKKAITFFPKDIALLEGYANLLKKIRTIKTLPHAIELYEQVIQLDPTKAQEINKKIKSCQTSINHLRRSN